MNDSQKFLFDEFFDSLSLLEELFASNQISLRRGRIFDSLPGLIDVDSLARKGRVEGMLMGVAVGDALGHSTEWKFDPTSRHEKYGTIVDHLTTHDARAGRISDDSQMTFWTLERILARGKFEFEDLVRCFVDRQNSIVGLGQNTAASLSRHRRRRDAETLSIAQCVGDPQNEGRGNGALMRFSPIVLPHLFAPSTQLWPDAVMSAFATHGNPVALSSILAMTHLLWQMLARPTGDSPSATWWIDEYLRVGGDLEVGPLPYPLNTDPIPKWFDGFRGTLCDFIDIKVRRAFRDGVPLRDACSLAGFGSRADCIQTVPAVLFVLMCHADSFESSIVAAVNDTKDNDTIAAIVGALVGALHGQRSIRRRWIAGIKSYSLKITGRESMSDREVMESMSEQAAHWIRHSPNQR